MANVKITDLPSLDPSSITNATDVLPIIDVSEDVTNKTTVNHLKEAMMRDDLNVVGSIKTENNLEVEGTITGSELLIGGSITGSELLIETNLQNPNIESSGLIISEGEITISSSHTIFPQISSSNSYDNDSDAGTGGVPLGGLYRSGSILCIRID